MIDDSALLKMIAQMQEKLNPPALVPSQPYTTLYVKRRLRLYADLSKRND